MAGAAGDDTAAVGRFHRRSWSRSSHWTSSSRITRNFDLEGTFGFGAWFGFLSCVVLIVFAKALGALLKRPDTYYDS